MMHKIKFTALFVADTAKTNKGFLSLKAFRLTPMTIQLYKSGDFTAEKIKDLKVTHDQLFEEVPIIIKNSHLVNELLLELSEQIPIEAGCQFLDLGTAGVLEEQLKYLIGSVDELNQVDSLICSFLSILKVERLPGQVCKSIA